MSLFKSPTASPRSNSRTASSTSAASAGFSSGSALTARPSVPQSTSLSSFRNLVFSGSVPLQISVSGGRENGEVLYVMASRVGYLALIKEDVRKMLGLSPEGEEGEEKGGWFEYNGVPLRWHWPIGLLADYHTSSAASSSSAPSTSSTLGTPQSYFAIPVPQPLTSGNGPPVPWPITFNLTGPQPQSLSTGGGSTIESCRNMFMNRLKEAEMIRWGTVKRVVNLRKIEQDGLWEGVKTNDYDKFWSVAGKLVPNPLTGARSPSPGATPSTLDSSNSVRNIPVKLYLPEGSPVIQELVSPTGEGGRPTTLHQFLSSTVPLLFSNSNISSSNGLRSRSATNLERQGPVVLTHGIQLPLETEMSWLAAALLGADGWLNLVIAFGSIS